MILVEDDVGNVAADLREIDPGLRLRYSENGGFFVVYHYRRTGRGPDDFREELVLTAYECDQRIVNRVREIDAQRRGALKFSEELTKAEDHRKRNSLEAIKDKQREKAERVYHDLRKEAGVKTRIYVP